MSNEVNKTPEGVSLTTAEMQHLVDYFNLLIEIETQQKNSMLSLDQE